jgi:peptidylprolyl isomerase
VTAAPTDPRQGSARRLSAAAVVGLLLLPLGLLAGGCSSGTSRKPTSLEDRVRVSGEFGQKPTITIATPLKVPNSTSWTLTKGDRDTVRLDSTTILQLTLADARTGKTAISTADPGQRPIEAAMSDQLFPSLVTALTGAKAGSRLVVASTAKDSYGSQGNDQLGIRTGDPVVMVADVLSSDPTTLVAIPTPNQQPLHPGLSSSIVANHMTLEGGKPSGFDFSGLRKPRNLESFVLQQGSGRRIEGPRRIVANYLGVVWGRKVPFDSSYAKEPAKYSVGLGGVVPCWDKALPGLRAGSRVVLVCPPATAYGAKAQPHIPANSTLVFVVDVLGVG